MRLRRVSRLFAVLSFTSMSAAATAAVMQGRVCVDANHDSHCARSERGVAEVEVSNGRDIVRSDAHGFYALPVQPGDTVFAIKPAGYGMPKRADGMPAFWQHYQPAASTGLKHGGRAANASLRFDVALQPLAQSLAKRGSLEVKLFADPQPKSLVDVGYYQRAIIEPLLANRSAAGTTRPTSASLGLSLGDIVDDDLSLYPSMNAQTKRLGIPWLHVAGNHDVDLDAHDDVQALETFRNTFGPDTFAWEEPEVHVVALDDVISTFENGRHRYIGGLRDDQFAFLERYLPSVPQDRLLVIALHIPLFEPPGKDTFRDADRARLFALLASHPKVLVLSGHNHTQQHVFHDARSGWPGATPLHEYNVGAACGAFWSGVKDAQGIPDSRMSDGTPNGFATLTVRRGGDYALAWSPARDPTQSAMHLSAPKVLRRGAYPAWGVYANVYMGRDDTAVDFRIDGGEWQPMQKVLQADPRVLAENRRDDEADSLRGYDRSPEATPTPHLWRGALPTRIAAGEHRVEVRAKDPWRGEVFATTTYRLQDATP